MFGEKVFKGVIRVKWNHQGAFVSSESTMWGHSEKPRRKASKETTLQKPWSQTSNLQNCDKIAFYRLNHPVCGILL